MAIVEVITWVMWLVFSLLTRKQFRWRYQKIKMMLSINFFCQGDILESFKATSSPYTCETEK